LNRVTVLLVVATNPLREIASGGNQGNGGRRHNNMTKKAIIARPRFHRLQASISSSRLQAQRNHYPVCRSQGSWRRGNWPLRAKASSSGVAGQTE